jgi:hypothetical protein
VFRAVAFCAVARASRPTAEYRFQPGLVKTTGPQIPPSRARYEDDDSGSMADWPVSAIEQLQDLGIGKGLVGLGFWSRGPRVKTANEEPFSFLSCELDRLTNRRR